MEWKVLQSCVPRTSEPGGVSMVELTKADLVWNRACIGKVPFPLDGDKALRALLSFHGLAMNGGILHALEYTQPEELAAAVAGYRYFGLDEVAEFIAEAKSVPEGAGDLDRWEGELDRRYGAFIPRDSVLVERFEFAFRYNPSQFAPL